MSAGSPLPPAPQPASPDPGPEPARKPHAATPGTRPAPAPPAAASAARARELPRLPGSRRIAVRVRAALQIVGFALFAFAVGLSVFNSVIMPRLIHNTAIVRVPDLSHLSYEQAERLLASLQLKIVRAGERFEAAVPRGLILSQDPSAETPVRAGGRVSVMVSLGEEFSQVPDMVGSSLRSARLQIDHAGLGLAGITRAPSDEIGPGMVAASDPPAGTVVHHNAGVGLLISSGPGGESFVMPNLLGRDLRTVKSHLESMGFKVRVPGHEVSGTVIFQNPPPGSPVAPRATLLIQGSESRR